MKKRILILMAKYNAGCISREIFTKVFRCITDSDEALVKEMGFKFVDQIPSRHRGEGDTEISDIFALYAETSDSLVIYYAYYTLVFPLVLSKWSECVYGQKDTTLHQYRDDYRQEAFARFHTFFDYAVRNEYTPGAFIKYFTKRLIDLVANFRKAYINQDISLEGLGNVDEDENYQDFIKDEKDCLSEFQSDQAVEAILSNIPEQQQTVVKMHLGLCGYAPMEYDDIANALGICVKTAFREYHRALTTLREFVH